METLGLDGGRSEVPSQLPLLYVPALFALGPGGATPQEGFPAVAAEGVDHAHVGLDDGKVHLSVE